MRCLALHLFRLCSAGVLMLYMAIGAAGCASSTDEARADARRDLRRGDLEHRLYGELWPAEDEYRRMLAYHLGVTLRRVAHDTLSQEVARDVDEYNRVMTAEIERRHGKGVLGEFKAEAERRVAAARQQATTRPK